MLGARGGARDEHVSAERCVACCRDSPRVTEAEIAELRREVSPGN